MKLLILAFLFSFIYTLTLEARPFSLYKHEASPSEPSTLLVIGGIHGNEPGSYFAAAILAQHYTITKGNLWVVPNLNAKSIAMNSRGVNGDMNRKFAKIDPNDPDAEAVQEIQNIITDSKVDIILNLHDGHGFYRKEYKNTIFNPKAWGQTCVIDQKTMDGDHKYKDLDTIASTVRKQINGNLLEEDHSFDIRNTNTRFDDEAMTNSLTYYAINKNKPAFAIETSKNLPTLHEKVFYQLQAIEGYMQYMGISYTRPFELTRENLIQLLKSDGNVTINNTSLLNLENLRSALSFIPLQSNSNTFLFSHPLGFTMKNKEKIDVYIGNKKKVSLSPSYHEDGECGSDVMIEMDKNQKNISFATEFFVTADFKVITNDKDIRVNIIGYTPKGGGSEANIFVSRSDLDPNYSIDNDKKIYRIEFYKGNRFCGMSLAHFK